MSFQLRDKDMVFDIDDCFDCPHISGPLDAHLGQKEAYVCEKKKKIVTMYNKNCPAPERWKAFEDRHNGKDFPVWCPIIEIMESDKNEGDFVDVFE